MDPLDQSLGDIASLRASGADPLGQVDRYILLEKIGQGGYGAVFRSMDSEAGVEVALKALPPLVSHSSDELESVRKNFSIVARLAHPNIATVRHLHRIEKPDEDAAAALSVNTGDYLVVMDYVRGSTLATWKHRFTGKIVPVDQALSICRQIAVALDYAHSERIIHRDVKPSNVMVMEQSSEGNLQSANVKVLDFGLAAEIRTSLSRVSLTVEDTSGTRPYMAPEQWMGRKQGPYTDQYALAVLFYELVSGSVPFSSVFETNDMQLMRDVVKSEPVQQVEGLSKARNSVLNRALSKDPAKRFPNCSAFIDALASGKPQRAPVGGKAVGRLVATLAVLALLAGGIFFGLSLLKERSAAPVEPAPLVVVEEPKKPVAPVPAPQPTFSCRFVIEPEGSKIALFTSSRGLEFSGASPATVELAAGEYELEAQRDGFKMLSVPVEVSKRKTDFAYELVPLRGGLQVVSTPGSVVTVAGTDRKAIRLGTIGKTGELVYDRLQVGEYQMTVVHPDHRPLVRNIVIRNGEPYTVKQPLEGLPGWVWISSTPQAEVWEGGRKIGMTGAKIDNVSPGSHYFEVRCAGYETAMVELEVAPNGSVKHNLNALVRQSGSIKVGFTSDYVEYTAGLKGRVRIDGGKWNTVPLPHVVKGLSCTSHKVELEVDGWQVAGNKLGVRETGVKVGQVSDVQFKLEPKPSTIRISCNIPGFAAYSKGTRLQLSDGRLALAPFQVHNIEIRADGFKPGKLNVLLDRPGEYCGTKRVELEKLEGQGDKKLRSLLAAGLQPEKINDQWTKLTAPSGDCIMLDRTTGLVWPHAPHEVEGNERPKRWEDAEKFTEELAYAGIDSWRLPSTNELSGLVEHKELFSDIKVTWLWGDEYPDQENCGWLVEMNKGETTFRYKTRAYYFIPVAKLEE